MKTWSNLIYEQSALAWRGRWDVPVNAMDLPHAAYRQSLEKKRSNLECNWFCPSYSKQTYQQKHLAKQARKLK